jgi:hypothetical protein
VATAWRAFPWLKRAHAGDRFSAQCLPAQSGQGRFDLPRRTGASAWYFAESPEHAIAEKLLDLRNRTLEDAFLFEHGHRLALCSVSVEPGRRVADLCAPEELLDRGIAPDRLAYRDRSVTQAISASLHLDPSLAGFRWWSSIFGEWHTIVLFSDRLDQNELIFGDPTPIVLTSTSLVSAALALGTEIER